MGKRGPKSRTAEEFEDDFWRNTDVKGKDGCWEWKSSKRFGGYGFMTLCGNYVAAHRYSLELKLGRNIKPGMCALHICDNPGCVNPNHLWEGTKSDNTIDMYEKGRQGDCANLGECNGNSTLKESQILEIRRIYRSGETDQTDIAKKFGVSQVLVGKIVRNELWTHVQEGDEIINICLYCEEKVDSHRKGIVKYCSKLCWSKHQNLKRKVR